MIFNASAILAASAKHPKPQTVYSYGTAGFRMEASLLDSVIFRVGMLAVLRSKSHNGKCIGVMITASHNPAKDNGVKLVEPLGEMLAQAWEGYATDLANANDDELLLAVLQRVVQSEGIDLSVPAKVVVARDTRPSGLSLVAALSDGVLCLGGSVTDYGLFTTPQLHYVTRCLNTQGTADSYGEPNESGYYAKLATAFKTIVTGKRRLSILHVDGANGIGAPALTKLAKYLGDSFSYELANGDTVSSEKLNKDCGADFVKLNQTKPVGMALQPGDRACSLDGDADRIVYYYIDQQNKFKLLDGDKIATLAASFIIDLVKRANVRILNADGTTSDLHVGLVQTAYANGSSTSYVKDVLKVPVVFTPTGVKHLHHEAEHFDVGVYFEANGHGTILFSKAATNAFYEAKGTTEGEKKALETLRSLTDLINQAVGDALSDMLMVEAVLTCQEKSLEQWDADYTDLPSRQEKVKVARRQDFLPIKADTELAAPAGIQDKINAEVAKYSKGRSFVRPSGTEDIVRVYAEASTREETETLANVICGLVFDGYGGVGERPAKFLPAK